MLMQDEIKNEPTELQKAIFQANVILDIASKFSFTFGEVPYATLRELLSAAKQLESMTEANKLLLLKLRDVVTAKDTKFKALQKENEGLKRTIGNVNKGKAHLMDLIDERDSLKSVLKQCGEALYVAIGTVECASIDLNTQEDLPWYKAAKGCTNNPLLKQIMSEKE